MTRITITLLIVILNNSAFSQKVSFPQLMNYFISGNEDAIKKSLLLKKYKVYKKTEYPGELFDSKQMYVYGFGGETKNMKSILVFKKHGEFKSVSYYTFDKKEVLTMLESIRDRNFNIGSDSNATKDFFYYKGDTVAVIQKTLTKDSQYVRYEIGVFINPSTKNTNKRTSYLLLPPQRAAAAILAISDLRLDVKAFALAGPPLSPPRLPKAAAADFTSSDILSLGISGGSVSISTIFFAF